MTFLPQHIPIKVLNFKVFQHFFLDYNFSRKLLMAILFIIRSIIWKGNLTTLIILLSLIIATSYLSLAHAGYSNIHITPQGIRFQPQIRSNQIIVHSYFFLFLFSVPKPRGTRPAPLMLRKQYTHESNPIQLGEFSNIHS